MIKIIKVFMIAVLLVNIGFASDFIQECKNILEDFYIPKKERTITINNAKVYWGGEELEDGMIDQFWLAQLLNSGRGVPANVQLVDVRKASEFKKGHILSSINIPWNKHKEIIDYTKLPKEKLIVFYCNTGMQSTNARNSLDDEVAKNVLIFDANVKCIGSKCTIEANEDL